MVVVSSCRATSRTIAKSALIPLGLRSSQRLTQPALAVFAAATLWSLSLARAADSTKMDAPAVELGNIVLQDGAAWAFTTTGDRAKLTLEPTLHRVAGRLLARAAPQSGAIVAIDARTGKLLVWAERVATGQAPGSVMKSDHIPAASVIKLVTAAALLDSAHVRPSREVCTDGGLRSIGPEHLLRPERGHATCGPFSQALGLSRNAAFAQLAHRFLSPEVLARAAARLGLGSEVPFDLPIPMGSLELPTDELGFARAASGFHGSTLTPLGGAYLAYIIASHGRPTPVHIVDEAPGYRAPIGRRLIARRLGDWSARQLARMMEFTVHGGTSLRAFSDPAGRSYLGGIRVAGKTGTLQPDSDSATTSWFIGFAPSRNPRVVVSVVLNNGTPWRRKANEVARDLLRAYFAARHAPGVSAPL